MAYDEGLAERLRGALEDQRGLSEKRMFGGLCFMLDGKMCVGIVKDELMVRVGAERHAEALKKPHARPMDFTGRPMTGFVYVAPEGLESDRELEGWVDLGVSCARSVKSAPAETPRRTTKAKRR
jgi:TfoX/Sxy family transcriptional regulator of competence genes